MIERLELFIQSVGLSIRAFEGSIGASNGMIRKAINNKTDIQSKWIPSIVDNYPQLNILWLFTGEGSMLLSPNTSQSMDNDAINKVPELRNSEEYLKVSDLMKALNDVTEAGKLNAIANERNSRNMEKMLDLISENSAKKELSSDQKDKHENTYNKNAAG